MKDQVDQLREKGIKALYLFSGMKPREIDIALDNAAYGNYKFLYVSPERLESELFLERAHKLNVSLIAVDEAHCISQWGYDFRPPYLKIQEIRDYFPAAPVLALTATATVRVGKDISEKLRFGKDSQVFRQGFDRQNIIYSVLPEDNKPARLLRLLQLVPGCAIVYAGNRRTCKEMAEHLIENGIVAGFYHAGLDHEERAKKQEAWKTGKIRVMVCTNAFGMGIDKADVRLIVHLNMPNSLEAYYQETGRAGRDGDQAYATALINRRDEEELRSVSVNHLDFQYLKRVYQALSNFLQVPEGSGAGQSFDFDLNEFIRRYGFVTIEAYKALKEIENAGFISLSDAIFLPSRLMIIVDHTQLYGFQLSNPDMEALIKAILRAYGGCFEDYVPINEKNLAKTLGITIKSVLEWLKQLDRLKLIDYLPQKTSPQLSFISARLPANDLSFGFGQLSARKEVEKDKIAAVLSYIDAENRCRVKILLNYFGEISENDCGHCDYCIRKMQGAGTSKYREGVQTMVMAQLKTGQKKVKELIENYPGIDEKELIQAVRWMLDRKIIEYGQEQYLVLCR